MTNEKGLVSRKPPEYLPVPITKEQAMYLLRTIWPKAPEIEIIKAGILCQQYGLNPLMRQVYLIQFGNEWVTVLGIKATRQIAQQALKKRGISYSYADGPRVMTEKEQVSIRGKVDPDKIWAITKLKDSAGNSFPGYGFWPAGKKPYGTDKGNDETNMAFIHSERNALDKLAPGELPDIEVGDDTYIEGDYRVAIEKGKKEFEQQVKQDIGDLYGPPPSEASPGEQGGQEKAQQVESIKEPKTEASTMRGGSTNLAPPKANSEADSEFTATDELLAKIVIAKALKGKNAATSAREWLTNVCKIEAKRIDTEPEKVWQEVSQFF